MSVWLNKCLKLSVALLCRSVKNVIFQTCFSSSEHSARRQNASSHSSTGMTCMPPFWCWGKMATWCGSSADSTSTLSSPCSSTWCSASSSLSSLTPMRPSRFDWLTCVTVQSKTLRLCCREIFWVRQIVKGVSVIYLCTPHCCDLILFQHQQQDKVAGSQLQAFIAECRDKPESGRYQTDEEQASCGLFSYCCFGCREKM